MRSPNKLGAEQRQSVSLLVLTMLTLLVSIGAGLLAVRLG